MSGRGRAARMGVRGVFFDLYGTLMPYGDMRAAWAAWLDAFHGSLTRCGLRQSREEFAQRTGVEPGGTVHVGDSDEDVQGAIRAGIRPILIRRDGAPGIDQSVDFRVDGAGRGPSAPRPSQGIPVVARLSKIAELWEGCAVPPVRPEPSRCRHPPAAASGCPLTAISWSRFRILCAHLSGPFGVEAVNAVVEERLGATRLLSPRGVWYRGRPVLLTCNEYHLRLFNGDVGITWPDAGAEGQLHVFFRGTENGMRRLAPGRLPAHETAYAATVHKSQGLEAEQVLLILPDEVSPVMTRELIYTALTRARSRVEIWGTRSVVEAAVARHLTRSSGLRDALWGHAETPPSSLSTYGGV